MSDTEAEVVYKGVAERRNERSELARSITEIAKKNATLPD